MSVTINTPNNKGSRLFLTLFSLPFLGVGVWMLISIVMIFGSWANMSNWETVQAQIQSGGYETSRGDDSNSYKAYGRYKYIYERQEYTNDRIAISNGSDNIGDFQQDLGNKLANYARTKQYINIFVNPNNPQESIVNRDIRWGMIGFNLVFVITFGGVGGGLLFWMIYAPKPKDITLPIYKDKPWLANNAWHDSSILSDSKTMVYFSWGFAILWNAISSTLPFIAYKEVIEKQNYAALLALLFPLVGIVLLIWAIRKTMEWKRFGPSPILLDPFPGSINGQVGGTIDLKLPYVAGNKFIITLTSAYSSGSGEDRNRSEEVVWQDKMLAHTRMGTEGTKITFRFDVPDDLKESDAAKQSEEYYLWRINMSADITGININRDFEIPVYKTNEKSKHISDIVVEHSESITLDMNEKAVREKINLTNSSRGTKIFYPMGRALMAAFGGMVAGSIFTGIGCFMIFHESMHIFGGIFALVGGLIIIASFYSCTNSLSVTMDNQRRLNIKRRILGVTTKNRSILISDITKITKKSNSSTTLGNKTIKSFTLYATGSFTGEIVIGEGFAGQREADTAINIIKEAFGIKT